ncbi:hypothetical protein EV360DRAFT_72294 [Lentinula raphanica]|nr:hypothetical protein EV360DRAFT_72294 [Lentinula raphanica]
MSYVTSHVGKMRVNIIEAAISVVLAMYGILCIPTENAEHKAFVKDLLTKINFIFPCKTCAQITNTTSIQSDKPYLHQAIITVLLNFSFKRLKSFSQHFTDTFESTSKTNDAKKVPQSMLSCIVIAVFTVIKEWESRKDE